MPYLEPIIFSAPLSVKILTFSGYSKFVSLNDWHNKESAQSDHPVQRKHPECGLQISSFCIHLHKYTGTRKSTFVIDIPS